jgi:hypothetical protein
VAPDLPGRNGNVAADKFLHIIDHRGTGFTGIACLNIILAVASLNSATGQLIIISVSNILGSAHGEEIARVMVRCIRTETNVGVAKARVLVKAMITYGDCMGANLVTTTDFTASCKNFTDDSDGHLALASGTELFRHLHILGRG